MARKRMADLWAARLSEIMNVHDVAQYLQCSIATLHRLIKKDEFPVFRFGRNLRFSRSDVERWIAERRVKAANGRRAK